MPVDHPHPHTVAALLDALERYLVRVELLSDRVVVEVAPERGRRLGAFQRLLGPGEYATEQLAGALLDAALWLNAQPEVANKVPTDFGRPLLEVEAHFAAVIGCVFDGAPKAVQLEVARQAMRVLEQWRSR